MSVNVFVFDIIATLVLACYLVYSYGNWLRQRIAVTLSVLIAWYFSFLIIFILPIDVSNTLYKQCLNLHNITFDPPSSHESNGTDRFSVECPVPDRLLPDEILFNLWRVVYWSSQLLTWLVLPLMQSYTQAGEFTVAGKLRSALWDNSIYYASYLFIAIILFIYIALQPNLHLTPERLKAIVASASNTWGLFVLVLMLGYGLVEVPRNCWKSAQKGYLLNRAYFQVGKLMSERTDAEGTAEEVVLSVHAISEGIDISDDRRTYVDTILSKIPLEMLERVKRRRNEESAFDSPTEKTLIRLHRQVIRALQTLHRTEAQWADMTRRVFELEDINRNMISNEHVFKHTSNPTPNFYCGKMRFSPTLEWYWRCLVSPLLLRLAAGLAALLSALIIWSEVTFFSIHPPLSMFALMIDLAKQHYNYWAIEIICFVTICYLSFCAYYTVFKIRILNFYYLTSNHQSDEYTLLFSGALLCRLTSPLCLNFLSLIHLDSHVIKSQIQETRYTQVMGHMDVISIVSDYFNVYFPMILIGLSIATYFSIGARLLTAIGFQQFLDQDSEITLEMVEEGKEHIKREKRRILRLMENASRKTRDEATTSARMQGTERWSRQSDIVKSDNASSSRRLLNDPSANSPDNSDRIDITSQRSDTLELDSPELRASRRGEPPRNIFDDW